MAAFGLHQIQQENSAFMTCILRVNVRNAGWQKTVMRVLNNINGVSTFRMDEDGMVEVSGTVDPSLLLKMLAKAGRRAELCWFQFGQCSSNLFIPDPRGLYGNGGYYGEDHKYYGGYGGNNGYLTGDDRYLHYGGGYGDRPRVKHWYKPFQPAPHGTRSHAASLGPVQQPPLTGEDISCCSLM